MSGVEIRPTSEVVVAGAGAGKTHALVTDYVLTVLGLDATRTPKMPQRVLAITFTDKAAAEMRRRVALRLAAVARNPRSDPDVLARAEALGHPVPEPRVTERLLRHLPNAPISTFHALCGALLRDLALSAGIDPGFAILDDVAERELSTETAEAVVLDRLAAGDTEVAALAARFQLRRLGFAKGLVDSLVDVHRSLAERGMTPGDIQPVVSAARAKERVFERRASLAESIKLLHELVRGRRDEVGDRVGRVVRSYVELHEMLERPEEHDELFLMQRALDVRERLLKAPKQQEVRRDREVRQGLESALYKLDALGAALCDLFTAPEAEVVKGLLEELHERVWREKNARGVLGFGDLLVKTRDLLRDEPSVRARVKGRFDRVLVDEYQDTSPVQEDLVALLAEEPSRGDVPPRGRPLMGALRLAPGRLFVVGDPKQSIYGFRGADARLFFRTLSVVTEGNDEVPPSGERRTLAKSWRSRPAILKLVNHVAEATLPAGPFGVELSPEDALSPHRKGGERAGALLGPELPKEMPLDLAEAIVVARKVRELLDEKVGVGDDDRPCSPRDIAVLVRRGKAAAPIARALAHEGVPAHVTGGEGFFSRLEVIDLIAALRLVVEPDDDLATLTVLRSPLVAAPDDAIVAVLDGIEGWRKGLSFSAVAAAAPKAPLDDDVRARILSFDRLLARLRAELGEVPVSRMVDVLIDETGYDLAVGIEPDAPSRLANLAKLRAMCEGSPSDAIGIIGRLWDFLDDPPQEGLAATVDPDVDAVRIMTIHQAKGLEFPIVVIADAGSALPSFSSEVEFDPDVGLAVSHRGRPVAALKPRGSPDRFDEPPAADRVRSLRRKREEAELARLLYVALTRARDHVFFVGEERKSGHPSLRRLLERARASSRGAFEALLPTEKVLAEPGPARPLPVSQLPPLDRPLGPSPKGPRRVAPSELALDDKAPAAEEAPLKRDPFDDGEEARRRGELLHHLVAKVGEGAGAGFLADDAAVTSALDAAARAEGEDPCDPRLQTLLDKARATLQGPVLALVEEGWALSFEEPLRYAHPGGAVLQGSADLVARAPGRALIVDFKSSRAAARAKATRVQLAAYAAAVAAKEQVAVGFSAWVIGDEKAPRPLPFDEAARADLEKALAAAARVAVDAARG